MSTSSSPGTRPTRRRRKASAQLPASEADAGGTRAEAVTTNAALEGLRPEWERLWAQSPHATPFQSPQWLLPWWRHVGRGTLASVALRCAADGELVGLAPLYLYRDPATGSRQLFPIGIATSDVLDLLVKPGWEEGVLRSLLQHLERSSGDWDVLEVPQLRPDSALMRLIAPAGWRQEIAPGETCPVLLLGDSHGGAPPPIPRAMAQNVRTARHRATRAGSLAYETADARTLPASLEAFVRLHAQRWTERGLAGALQEESVLAFHREAAALLQAAGLLRLHMIRLDGELIAALYCLADTAPGHERRCYYYLGGFDPSFASLSPGTLLVAHAIEQARAEGAIAFDFLRGRESYKYRWGAIDQPMFTLRLWHA